MDSPIARLKASMEGLPPIARRIASIVVESPERVLTMSVSDLAAAAEASDGSVIGLCRQIGIGGFPDLKIAIAREISAGRSLLHEALGPSDTVADVMKKISASHMLVVQDTMKVLDTDAVERAVEVLGQASRIEFYGIGTAAPVAEDAAYRFLRLGLPTKCVTDSHGQAVSAAFTGKGVATVTISHSGRTVETLTSTRLAKETGAKTICITNYGKSPLQKHCDIVLFTAAQEAKYRMEAMSSRIAQFVIVDILFAGVAARRWSKSIAAIQKSYEILSGKRVGNGS
jgi:DNA-binding MurR/RpiR family transcriptional regulator